MQKKRIRYVQDYRVKRDQSPVKKALENLNDLTQKNSEENLFEPIMDAVFTPGTGRETILRKIDSLLSKNPPPEGIHLH
jgi:hypothetical protein